MSICAIRKDRYDEFHYRILQSDELVLINNYIEVTYKCNLYCQHCYNPKKKETLPEISTKEVIYFIDRFAEAGCLWLNFSGGEPFLRPDFLEFYSYTKAKGLLVGILTNGTRITKKIAKALGDDPPLSIDVTIYGASPKTYEIITKVADGFKLCLEGIDNLLEAGIKPHLQTCVSILNKNDITEIKKLADKRGLKYHYDPHIHPRIDGDRYPLSLRLSPQEVSEMMLSDTSLHGRIKEYLEYYVNHPCRNDHRLVKCGMLQEGFWMDPYGRVRMCAIIPQPNYDLRSGGSLKEAWDMFSKYVDSQKPSAQNPCLKCDVSFFCMQCVAWSELQYRDWNRKVDFICEIAHYEIEKIKELGLWPQSCNMQNLKGGESYARKEETISKA